MKPAVKKEVDLNRLRADLASAAVEILSAHCASDRVRLQYPLRDIVTYGERQALKRAIASVQAMHQFFSQLGAQIQNQEASE